MLSTVNCSSVHLRMTSSSSSSSSSSVRLQCRGWSGPLLEGLNELRHERALCDLTIVSATGHVHMAHACVLAAASSYVRAHVLHAPARYPPVMLPISDDTWYTVLRFVYTGETRLQSGRLESLRRAAMTLGIHRLTTAANTLIRQLRAAVCTLEITTKDAHFTVELAICAVLIRGPCNRTCVYRIVLN